MEAAMLRRLGDSAIAVEFSQAIDPRLNARVLAIGEQVRREGHDGVRDVIEGYCSVTVVFDPLRTDIGRLTAALETAAAEEPPTDDDGPSITLPVRYGGTYGPDLADVAKQAGCTVEEVVALHTEPTYRVYLLGFLPGFAYLGQVPDAISAPRRARPRLRVPAGSVGIAGRQTGVYPIDSPGGWQLIGHCPLRIFDRSRPDPFLLHPGHRVRFQAVEETGNTRTGRAGGA